MSNQAEPDPLANWTVSDQAALITLLRLRMGRLGNSDRDIDEMLTISAYVDRKVAELTDGIVRELGVRPKRRRAARSEKKLG